MEESPPCAIVTGRTTGARCRARRRRSTGRGGAQTLATEPRARHGAKPPGRPRGEPADPPNKLNPFGCPRAHTPRSCGPDRDSDQVEAELPRAHDDEGCRKDKRRPAEGSWKRVMQNHKSTRRTRSHSALAAAFATLLACGLAAPAAAVPVQVFFQNGFGINRAAFENTQRDLAPAARIPVIPISGRSLALTTGLSTNIRTVVSGANTNPRVPIIGIDPITGREVNPGVSEIAITSPLRITATAGIDRTDVNNYLVFTRLTPASRQLYESANVGFSIALDGAGERNLGRWVVFQASRGGVPIFLPALNLGPLDQSSVFTVTFEDFSRQSLHETSRDPATNERRFVAPGYTLALTTLPLPPMPIPEPGTAGLLALGLAGLSLVRRRLEA